MFEVVIMIVIAVAAWFFMSARKKEGESVDVLKASSESEPEAIVQHVTERTGRGSDDAERIPEDSALRRHYLQNQSGSADSAETAVSENILTQKAAPEPALVAIVQQPVTLDTNRASDDAERIPEDSALRRHYLQNLDSSADIAETVVSEAVVTKSVTVKPVTASVIKGAQPAASIPEDAALKRHFIQQLTAKIAAEMPEHPTDSTLKRHYDTQLSSAVLSQLDALK